MSDYMAHGYCLLWEPKLVWLHVISDILIGLAYISIPIAIGYFIFKRRDLPYTYMFVIFALFIFACGGTHFFAAYTIFVPMYWQEGYLKAFTALISIIATILFIPMIPKALSLPSLPKALDNIQELNKKLADQFEQLRSSENKYRRLYNETPVLLHSLDQDGHVIEVNEYWLKTMGYDRNEVIGRSVTDFYTETSKKYATEVTHPAFYRDGSIKNIAYQFVKKNGELLDVMVSAIGERDAEGRVVRSFSVIENITDRKHAEESLRKTEEKLAKFFMLAPAGISVSTLDEGRILDINKEYERLFGYSRDEVIGRTSEELGLWANTKDREQLVHLLRTAGTIKDLELHLRRRNGEVATLRYCADQIEIDNSPCLLSAFVDFTEKKKLEDQLRQSQKIEGIGQLAGGIAHDFNNILSAIIGYGNIVLMKMEKDDPQRLNVEHMLEAGARAARLTQDLLLFSRKQISERNPLDLNNVVRKVETFLKRVIGEDIECRTNLSKEAVTVLGDTHQLEQVLMNLATNARDAMPTGGTFIITTEDVQLNQEFLYVHGYGSPGYYGLITISDTGKGMDPITRERIFEPFFTTKEVGKGTGLGLSVVYGIIKQHDGFINVYSEPGQGTTFKVYLPLVAIQPRETKIIPPPDEHLS